MDLILDLNGINAIWDVEEVGQKIVLLSQSSLMSLILLNGFGAWLCKRIKYLKAR